MAIGYCKESKRTELRDLKSGGGDLLLRRGKGGGGGDDGGKDNRLHFDYFLC